MPVNNLPPELLSHIFCLGTAAEDEESGEVSHLDHIMDWIGSVYEEDDDDDDDDGDSCGSDDEDEDDETTSSESSSELESDLPFQVLVSHVCKRWRYIAI